MRLPIVCVFAVIAVSIACSRSGPSEAESKGNEPGPSAAATNAPRMEAAPKPVDTGLKEGSPAPAFQTKGDDGKTYSLAALKGKTVILYFYPKDDTPGCTVEAKSFRDDSDKYAQKGAVVLGVSMDDAASHQAFRAKYGLNFPLLVDGAPIAQAYGVPVSGGYASRQTFVIGPDGALMKIFRSVNPSVHSAEILSLLK
jgi:peroxiredoxin Q/BCP